MRCPKCNSNSYVEIPMPTIKAKTERKLQNIKRINDLAQKMKIKLAEE